ncbi:hypothetical protein QM588_18355 [Rhodococcus sp. IEGM 1354]|uniref:hypothetical protein n=1 Tax=Rhodococcus sp. IEGM 1354 TaxID=3047088 RepID=UPI0024B760BD|nr:hypothetical protein [Rhodococcus sp. IEGM 1354]MDI9932381.1 hypothetical protein [Rhodococcus sp. IEGM 1354]
MIAVQCNPPGRDLVCLVEKSPAAMANQQKLDGNHETDQGRDSDLKFAGQPREECHEGVDREMSPVRERGSMFLRNALTPAAQEVSNENTPMGE